MGYNLLAVTDNFQSVKQQAVVEAEKEPELKPPESLGRSPRWTAGTKRLVVAALLVVFGLAFYRVRILVVPIILALVIAYVLLPLVDLIHKRTKFSRNLTIAIVYLLISGILVAIPALTIPPLINQVNNLVNDTPEYINQLVEIFGEPLTIGGYQIPLDQLPVEEAINDLGGNLLSLIQAIGPSGFTLFGNLATATLSTLGWLLIVLVLSFYFVKDYRVFWSSFIELTPENYREDIEQLGREINDIWNAFLRGQLILGIMVGLATFVLAMIIGLPNALLLALLAGILEFIPNIGPILASIPAVILALFQTEVSWLGQIVGPFWFALIVLLIYGLVQRVENIVLQPRIIGRSLNLHPFVVFVGAIAGASIAGIFGILLAAPVLASIKLILLYIYHKLLDQQPFSSEDRT